MAWAAIIMFVCLKSFNSSTGAVIKVTQGENKKLWEDLRILKQMSTFQ